MDIPSLASFIYKRADGPHLASISPEHGQFNEGLKAEVLRRILRIGLMGAVGGAGFGLMSNFLGKHEVPRIEADDPDVDLPYPQLAKKGSVAENFAASMIPLVSSGIGAAYGGTRDISNPTGGALYGGIRGLGSGAMGAAGFMGGRRLGEHMAGGKNEKLATLLRAIMGSLGSAGGLAAGDKVMDLGMRGVGVNAPWDKKADWADSLVHNVMPTTPGDQVPSLFSSRWLRGDTQTNLSSIPWAWPAGMAAGVGGVWAGNKLVRHLLDKKRKAELESELSQAKKEYEEAMMGQYSPEKIHSINGKTAAAPNKLASVYAVLEKRGDVNTLLGHGAGAYLTLASLLAGGIGVGTYKHLHSRSRSKMLTEALKQRALLRGLSNPPEVFLHPVPAHLRHTREGDSVEENNLTNPTAV
jgi:hypothetical protein